MLLKGNELVEKRNILNEIRHNNMTLQELRFFSIYLAKINARDISTRKVKFKLEDFQKIMNLGELKIEHLKRATDSLLQKIVHIPREDGSAGYSAFQLFKECEVYKDADNFDQWYVEIDAHDKALPLMFDFKEKYFTYDLGNILRLTGRNQFRMYELLKQCEPIGMREISLEQLKSWLGIDVNKYPVWKDFKIRIIDACQKVLKTHTDIEFEYEKIKASRRVVGVRFLIKKNKDYKNPLGLEEFLANKPIPSQKTEKRFYLNPNDSFTLEDLKKKANG